MRLYVYANESGAFDKVHNDWFVYGGLVLVGHEAKTHAERRYIAMEREIIASSDKLHEGDEVKASRMTLRERKRVFRSIARPGCHQFAVIVDQKKCHANIFDSKRRKQRFLDYALKRGVKQGIIDALAIGNIPPSEVDGVRVVVDEHSTSTDGKYNLVESINE